MVETLLLKGVNMIGFLFGFYFWREMGWEGVCGGVFQNGSPYPSQILGRGNQRL